jgi:hypothetical protein
MKINCGTSQGFITIMSNDTKWRFYLLFLQMRINAHFGHSIAIALIHIFILQRQMLLFFRKKSPIQFTTCDRFRSRKFNQPHTA